MSSISLPEKCVVCGSWIPHITDEDYWHCDHKAFIEMLEEVNRSDEPTTVDSVDKPGNLPEC